MTKRDVLRLTVVLAAMSTGVAHAHFTFVVPSADGSSASVIMSETLVPEEGLETDILSDLRLFLRTPDGKDHALSLEQGDEKRLTVQTAGSGIRIVHGKADLGVRKHGSAPHLLLYYPKTVIGSPFASTTVLGGDVPVEIEPVADLNQQSVRLKLLVNGSAQPESELTLIHPDGSVEKVLTDEQGFTPPLTTEGRYGAWARFWEDKPGERDGEPYAQVRHYATLVFDFDTSSVRETEPSTTEAIEDIERWIDLPIRTASFGAVASNGWLYLYGGHIAPTHQYHTESASGDFWRLDLVKRDEWETLPGGPRLQGMNLAACDGMIYRIGGMRSLNASGEPADNRSTDQCAAFDPASLQWTDLPALPAPRSSHDVVALGRTLYVLGGWHMRHEDETIWHDEIYTLDLDAPKLEWATQSQPFRRRALIVAALDGRIYVMGGFNESRQPSLRVEILDTRSGKWSEGPNLPEPTKNGFAPAACVHDRRLYVSVGDGGLYRLDDDAGAWALVARTTPRIVHRLVPFGSKILLLGGAADGDNLSLVEVVAVNEASAPLQVAEGIRPVAQSDSSPSPRRQAAVHPVAMGQRICPIMTDNEIDRNSPTVMYRGQPVALCCQTCMDRWANNPDEYAAVATDLPQLAGLTIPERALKQQYCPVFRDRVVTTSDPYVEYQGRKVYLFNSVAVERWKADPSRYVDVAILPQLVRLDRTR